MNNDYWKKYWNGRWERNETGWHQAEVEPLLIKNFSNLPSNLAAARVFVPLCGKSLDLKWLEAQGHEVIGVEMNESACRSFFVDNKVEFHLEKRDGFNIYRGGKVTILNGDIFEVEPDQLGQFDVMYDRAALIALHPGLRTQYAKHITDLVRSCVKTERFKMLQIVLERTPHDNEGPPFSILPEELDELYGAAFKIKPLSREQIDMEDMGDSGASVTTECAYDLVKG